MGRQSSLTEVETMISTTIAHKFGLTNAALEVLEAAGATDELIEADFAALEGEGEALLASCLDGADDDHVAGWEDYVTCLVVARDAA